MKVTDKKYYNEYYNLSGKNISSLITDYDFSEKNGEFDYLIKASAVYSSNIEGNSIDLNSYMNYEFHKKNIKPGRELDEIKNLIAAYKFSQENSISESNLLIAHKIFSETLLIKSKRGKYREEKIGVFGNTGLTYLAVEPEFVEKEMKKYFSEIYKLLESDLTEAEVFYHASLIHLKFAHIHPFSDGNGRASRLLEKWFLAEKLGNDFWKIQSEKYYKEHLQEYYKNINLGVNFYELDYRKCIEFLIMLPECLK